MSDNFGINAIDSAITSLLGDAQPTGGEPQETQPETTEVNTEVEGVPEQVDPQSANLDTQGEHDSETVDAESDQTPSDILEAYVNDGSGRKKISIDLSDRELVKRQVKLAAQAPRWKKEADTFRSQVESLKEAAENYQQLDSILSNEGPEGLMDRVLISQGIEGGLEAYIQQKVEEAKFLDQASPEELEVYKERKEKETLAKRIERMERQQQEREERIAKETEAAKLAERQSQVNPIFSKYRFQGKLGNPDQEHAIDSMIWKATMSNLSKLEEGGNKLTNAVIEREFKKAAKAWNATVNRKVKQNTNKALKQKKAEAMEAVQSSSARGIDKGKDTISSLIGGRDWDSLFDKVKFKL